MPTGSSGDSDSLMRSRMPCMIPDHSRQLSICDMSWQQGPNASCKIASTFCASFATTSLCLETEPDDVSFSHKAFALKRLLLALERSQQRMFVQLDAALFTRTCRMPTTQSKNILMSRYSRPISGCLEAYGRSMSWLDLHATAHVAGRSNVMLGSGPAGSLPELRWS